MDSDHDPNDDLAARLRRLDATATATPPGFDYAGLLERHEQGMARSRRTLKAARGTAIALTVALVAASVWRIDHVRPEPGDVTEATASATAPAPATEQRIVRADTYLAVA